MLIFIHIYTTLNISLLPDIVSVSRALQEEKQIVFGDVHLGGDMVCTCQNYF